MKLYSILGAICVVNLLSVTEDLQEKELLKCGSEIEWVKDINQAYKLATERKRLILWYVPRIKGNHMRDMYVGHLDYYMKTGPFTNPEIVTLIKRKFVPLNMKSTETLGIKAPEFMEPGLVFVTPDKKIVHKISAIRTFNDEFFYNQFLLVLEKNPEFNTPSEEAEKAKSNISMNPLNYARELACDGNLTEAEKLLSAIPKGKSDEVHAQFLYELGRVCRLLRKGGESLNHLKEAREKSSDKKVLGDITVEEGLVLLKSGKIDEARAKYERVRKEYPDCPRITEAFYYLGAIYMLASEEKMAREVWEQLVKDGEKKSSPWTWKAVAGIVRCKDTTIGESAITHAFEELCWLNDVHYKTLLEGTVWKRGEGEISDVIKKAVDVLLKSQRSDGAWNDSRQIFAGTEALPNVYMAITAICASALLEHRDIDPKRIDQALGKAISYLFDESKMARGKKEEVYSDGYRLLFLSKLLTATTDKDIKEKAKDFMTKLVKELEKQQKGGHFQHEYANSFSTSTVVHCLQMAKNSGIDIPQKLFDGATKALNGCRAKDGTFSYYGSGKGFKVQGSAGRMPLCEMALYFGGSSSLESIELALEAFFKHHDLLLRVRKSDNHTDAYMNAGFFYFHDLYAATEAAKLLKAEPKKKFMKQFVDVLISLSEIDGAFVDAHQLGRSYGTAMAILALKNCTSK